MSRSTVQQPTEVIDLVESEDDASVLQVRQLLQKFPSPPPRRSPWYFRFKAAALHLPQIQPRGGAAGPSIQPGSAPRVAGMRRPPGHRRDSVDFGAQPDIEILSSTQPLKKRPRMSPSKQALLNAALAPRPPPPPDPEPPGPKCGICFEPMGSSTERQMWAGNCG